MIENESLEYMLRSALCAGLEAGKNIMKIYNNDEKYNVNLKSDNTLIIEADRVSHETIRKMLSKTRIPLMSEEGRDILFEERYGWDLYWLVDPIDGTLEFVNKSKEFSICIALMEERTPIIGVIIAPALRQVYLAVRGYGSFKVEDIDFTEETTYDIDDIRERAVKISCDTELPSDNIKVLTTLSNPNRETEDMILELKERYRRVDRRPCGSALKFCEMAEGKAHLYFRTTPLKDWDTAAGEVIALESGLTVSTLEGQPLIYNNRELSIKPLMVSYHKILY